MKQLVLFLLIILLSLFSLQLTADENELPVGVVIDTVFCVNDSTQSYAIYLPSNYHPYKIWPIIYCFDAAARGKLPVERYAPAAEKFGYIIVGSNNSRNGPWEPVFNSIVKLTEDTEQRFEIDPQRVYSTGFSGGSRVACSFGIINGNVAGVIGNGAGFSNSYPPNYQVGFKYVGLVGNEDFNYREMRRTGKWLNMFDIQNYIYEYDGDHGWAPAKVFEEALLYMEFRALEKKTYYLRDETYLNEFIQSNEEKIKFLQQEGKYFEMLQAYQKLIAFVGTLKDTGEWEQTVNELLYSDPVKAEMEHRNKLEDEEYEFMKTVDKALYSIKAYDYDLTVTKEPKSFWKSLVKKANKLQSGGRSTQDSLLGIRMNNYIYWSAFIRYEGGVNNNEHDTAPDYLDLMSFAKPEGYWAYYLYARYFSGEGYTEKAFKMLEKAIEKGFNDLMYFETDPEMKDLIMSEYHETILSLLL